MIVLYGVYLLQRDDEFFFGKSKLLGAFSTETTSQARGPHAPLAAYWAPKESADVQKARGMRLDGDLLGLLRSQKNLGATVFLPKKSQENSTKYYKN